MNKYSYITLLSDDSYIYGVILLQESLRRVKSKYPLKVLVTSNVTPPIINMLEQLKLEYEIIEPVQYKHIIEYNKKANPLMTNVWALCLSKLKIFEMTEMDKWIFLDADIMIMKNIDHLFEYPHLTSALDGEYFNLWPDWDHFNSGILVIEPNKEEYNNLIDFIINDALNETWKEGECIADQEILNHYYSDWINKPELHLNKYYDIFAPYIGEDQINDIDENCYFIHFVGRKPWRAFIKSVQEKYTEKYYEVARQMIYDIIPTLNWNSIRKQIKITIYSICKNEIEKIQKFLECFHITDYVCILDTGSTDGTWEYLQEAQKIYPNLIIDQKIIDPWRYDNARNTSLTLVPKDTTVYFMMDLDELIFQKDWVNLIRASWDPAFRRGQYIYHRMVDETTNVPLLTFYEHRIHNSSWHYHGIVHEQLYNVAEDRIFFDDECIKVPIIVWHFPKNTNNKSYIELCERAVEEEPNNWLMHLQLAIEYEVHNEYLKAIEEYKKIIIESDGLASIEMGRCYASLGKMIYLLGNDDEALQILKKGRELIPECGDNYFIAADIQQKKQDFNQVFSLCQEGISNSTIGQWCTLIDKDGYIPLLLMGIASYNLGNQILGLGYIALAREKNNNKETNDIYQQIVNQIINRG